MNSSQAKTIQISEYLSREGYRPQKYGARQSELWYISPIRQKEDTPSFKVDTVENIWYDHGLAKGGNIVDLVIELRKVTVKQALNILESTGLYRGGKIQHTDYKPRQYTFDILEPQKHDIQEEEKFDILDIQDLTNQNLIEYLESRKINQQIASKYLKQIHFKPRDKIRTYYCLALQTDNGGYEARSQSFKGFIGLHKDITTINGQKEGTNLLVFEGFIDFLSCLTYHNITDFEQSAIILNTISLRKKALEIIQQGNYKKVYFYLDNDEPGRDTQDFFNVALEGSNKIYIDKSPTYGQYNDFNDMLCGVKNHG